MAMFEPELPEHRRRFLRLAKQKRVVSIGLVVVGCGACLVLPIDILLVVLVAMAVSLTVSVLSFELLMTLVFKADLRDRRDQSGPYS